MKVKDHLIILLLLLLTGCGLFRYIAPRSEKPHRAENGYLFQFYAPSASKVLLAGDFNNWESKESDKIIRLKKRDDGIWWVIIPLKPGRYKYKFVIDDNRWEPNPNGDSANDPDNNSLIIVE